MTRLRVRDISTSNQPHGTPNRRHIICLGTLKRKRHERPRSVSTKLFLIADRAFRPFQCVAWAPQDGNGELSLTVIDRTNTHIGRTQIPSSAYTDPVQLADLLKQARAELSQEGYTLQSWSMPE